MTTANSAECLAWIHDNSSQCCLPSGHAGPHEDVTGKTADPEAQKEITDQQYIAAAKKKFEREGEIEIDGNAKTSRGAEDGCYVQAWVWVYNDEIEAA